MTPQQQFRQQYRTRNVLFAIRGVLAFVAFTEISGAARCLLPFPLPDDRELGQSYVRAKVFNRLEDLGEAEHRTFCHLYGLYSLLNGLIVLHLAVYVHYRPFVSLTLCALVAKLIFFLGHSPLGFGTIGGAPNLVFPIVTCLVSIVVAAAVPFVTARPHFE